jgi:hypothetical protein
VSKAEDQALMAGSPGGRKFDNGKQDWLLLMRGCRLALTGALRVLSFGVTKYGEDNWQLVEPHSRYVKALYRHLDAIAEGGLLAVDHDSGELHAHHVSTNSLFLGHFAEKARQSTPLSVDTGPRPVPDVLVSKVAGLERCDAEYPVPTGSVPRREAGSVAATAGRGAIREG